jgi:hypothetical protein
MFWAVTSNGIVADALWNCSGPWSCRVGLRKCMRRSAMPSDAPDGRTTAPTRWLQSQARHRLAGTVAWCWPAQRGWRPRGARQARRLDDLVWIKVRARLLTALRFADAAAWVCPAKTPAVMMPPLQQGRHLYARYLSRRSGHPRAGRRSLRLCDDAAQLPALLAADGRRDGRCQSPLAVGAMYPSVKIAFWNGFFLWRGECRRRRRPSR